MFIVPISHFLWSSLVSLKEMDYHQGNLRGLWVANCDSDAACAVLRRTLLLGGQLLLVSNLIAPVLAPQPEARNFTRHVLEQVMSPTRSRLLSHKLRQVCESLQQALSDWRQGPCCLLAVPAAACPVWYGLTDRRSPHWQGEKSMHRYGGNKVAVM